MKGNVGTWGWDGKNYQWRKIRVNPDGSLMITSETALDIGVATGGTVNTLVDNTKGWQVNIWEDAIVEIVDVSTGISYTREIDSNTADTLDFTTHPLPAAVVAGDTYSIRRVVSPLSPLNKGIIHNTGVLANTDFFGVALTPTNTPCLFRVVGGFSAAGILNVTITRAGNTQTQSFNHAVVLVPNALFMFDHFVNAGDTINYQYMVPATIQTFKVQEIVAAAQ